jgi:hypothetical protein
LKLDKAEIKFQLYEGREKQILLERYLLEDSEMSYMQGLINPYTGENIESNILGSARNNIKNFKLKENDSKYQEENLSYDSQEDILNLSKLIKYRGIENEKFGD